MNDFQYDAIILPGSTLDGDGNPSNKDKARLEEAAKLYQAHVARAIIVCGSHGYKAVRKPVLTEAEAYAQHLQTLAIPAADIYLETQSQETMGNFLFAKTQILMRHGWRNLLVIPTYNHSTERVDYLLTKALGSKYYWDILRVGENKDPANAEREARSLHLTKEINDPMSNGDHETVQEGLFATHPAYGGKKWTTDELRKKLS